LIDRSRIANKSKADLFISIHANICSTPSIRGTETFFLGPAREGENLDVAKKENSVILLEEDYSTTYEGFDPNSSESYIMFEMVQSIYLKQSLYLADAIQQQFKSRSDAPNRGVKQAGFLVLRMSSMPSVLVETGFLSNPQEVNFLNSNEGQQHIALSIFEAFKKFKNKNSIAGDNKAPEVIARHQKPQDSTPKQEVRIENKKIVDAANEVIASHQKPQDSTPRPEVRIVNKKIGDTTKMVVVDSTINSKKTVSKKDIAQSPAVLKDITKTSTTNYYSVQIGANTTPVEPNAGNFKGLKDVRREKEDKYFRYYIGHENDKDNIATLLKQTKLKFPQAFIVSFIDGKRIPVYGGLK
jgi:N-acetylmuramoyl-L-alanine amidase